MIAGMTGDLARYLCCHPNLDAAIAFLQEQDFFRLPDGDYPDEGGRFHMNISSSRLDESPLWTARREHISLQVVLSGSLSLRWAPLNQLEGWSAYDPQRDLQTSGDAASGSQLELQAGMFALFFPEEAFRPQQSAPQLRKAEFWIKNALVGDDAAEVSPLKALGTQTLSTPKLCLRQYALRDAQAMFDNWASDPEVTKTLMWDTHTSPEHTRRLLAGWIKSYDSGRFYHWVIEKEGQPIGDIALVSWSPVRLDGEIGYCLAKKYWNQGLMTEALQAVMRFLFEEVGFRRLILRHAMNNPASGRVMEKAGLRYEGRLRQAYLEKDGGFSDLALYAALKEEWLKREAL